MHHARTHFYYDIIKQTEEERDELCKLKTVITCQLHNRGFQKAEKQTDITVNRQEFNILVPTQALSHKDTRFCRVLLVVVE